MQMPIQVIRFFFEEALQSAFPEIANTPEGWGTIDVTQSTQAQFGHYQCNSAMKLSKVLKQNPRHIADVICKNLPPASKKVIEKIEIAGPGFINITLTNDFLASYVEKQLTDPHLAIPPLPKHQKVIIDFSSPNTAKEMHVGHLRSTIIGDCLARTFEFLGYDVLRLNHIGDWGTAFGMLIAYIKLQAPEVLQRKRVVELPQLVEWYRDSKKKFDEDAAFKKTAQLEVVALQKGEPDAREAWELICAISRKAYQEIYDLLDVKVLERGESFYNPFLPEVVADLESKGLVTVSDGAKCIFLEGFQNREGKTLPLMIQKSDGGYNYDTTDMAAMRQRVRDEKADRIIIITDAGQGTHFAMIFKAAEKAGYFDPTKVKVDHVPFGLVLGADGKKFRTRSGDTERLIDLLTIAIEKAQEILAERSPEMPSEERKQIGKALGIGAVKYADLSCNRTGDYVFSYDRMLKFEGNTAAFLMYSYVRTEGIKRKVGVDIEKVKKESKVVLQHPSEIALALRLAQFGEALEQVVNELLPNRLTDYLYGLAEDFNAFFRDCRVEGTPEQNARLLLCEDTARVLKQGLHLLGVETVNKM